MTSSKMAVLLTLVTTAVMVLHPAESSMINNGNLLRFLNTLDDEGAMPGNRLENRQFGPRPMGVAQGPNSIGNNLALDLALIPDSLFWLEIVLLEKFDQSNFVFCYI